MLTHYIPELTISTSQQTRRKTMIEGCVTWVKYYLIIMKALIIGESVVEMFGSTYVVYGNVVKKVRD